ncbi:hypothetical protein [Parafrankia sp. FMc2]|uniref:hypothetical protein n=1 Tax=Parafrankia sp. FMc2 TaxID=3233196 RepID=UPI0034D4A9C4
MNVYLRTSTGSYFHGNTTIQIIQIRIATGTPVGRRCGRATGDQNTGRGEQPGNQKPAKEVNAISSARMQTFQWTAQVGIHLSPTTNHYDRESMPTTSWTDDTETHGVGSVSRQPTADSRQPERPRESIVASGEFFLRPTGFEASTPFNLNKYFLTEGLGSSRQAAPGQSGLPACHSAALLSDRRRCGSVATDLRRAARKIESEETGSRQDMAGT